MIEATPNIEQPQAPAGLPANTDLQAPAQASSVDTYGPGIEGVKQAAADLHKLREKAGTVDPEPVTRTRNKDDTPDRIEARDGITTNKGISAREAAQSISRAKQQEAEDHAELQKIIHGDAPAAEPAKPSPEVEARLQEVERVREEAKQDRTTAAAERQLFKDHFERVIGSQFESLLSDVPELRAALEGRMSHQDFHNLAVTDPAKYQRACRVAQSLMGLTQAYGRHTQAASLAEREEFKTWSKQQDELADSKLPPELKTNTEAAHKFRAGVVDTLRHHGITDDELQEGWNGAAQFSLRDARAQAIIADAARYRMLMANANDVRARKLPPAVRPGNGKQRGIIHNAVTVEQLRGAKGLSAARLGAQMIKQQRDARR